MIKQLLDPTFLITTLGLFGVFGIVFAESGLLIGFFLPGDSLLFTAGFLASQGYFNILILAAGSAVAAIVGDSVGYWVGAKMGPRVFNRPNSRWLNPKHVERTQEFYNIHGKKTIILARFIPIVRTFTPVMAGVGKMEYPIFLSYNIVGGLLWGAGMPLAGYFLGKIIPSADKYLLPIIAVIIIVSLIPALKHFLKK
jgi:membrane-associated protein